MTTTSMDPDDFGDETEPKRGRGRPKGSGKGKTVTTTVTRQTSLDGEEKSDDDVSMTFGALFDAGPDDKNDEIVTRVRVNRAEPKEGMLGYIEDMDATESYIRDEWGGSTYLLQGLNNRGKIIRVRSIVIGGDPKFVGEAFDLQWRRQKGLPPKSANGAAPGEQMSMKDMLAVIEAREIALRKELADKEDRDRRERIEAAETRRKDEREFQMLRERDAREWEEKRQRDQAEVARVRRAEDDDRESRRRRDNEEATTRSQQFMTQMLTIVQQQASNSIAFVKETVAGQQTGKDPSDMLMKGITLALQLKEAAGGGGEDDLLTTVVKNLPEMLNSAGNAVGKAVREVRGQPAAPTNGKANGLMLPAGPVSDKFAALVNRITESGGNPEATLAALADRLLATAPPLPKKPPSTGNGAPVVAKTVFDPGPVVQEIVVVETPSPQSANSTETPKVVPEAPKVEEPGVTRMAFKKATA